MSDLGPGEFRLRSSITPTLPAGGYEARLEHTVDLGGPIAPVMRHFDVVAPQFALPATELQSVYPPPNSEGAYGTRLAQIVLQRRTLPWEREVTPGDPHRRPWLALVVLTDAEAQLKTGRPVTEAVPAALHTELGVTADSGTCDYLETTPAVVAATFPRPDELSLLCHVREVSVADTELAGSDADGQLAVVLCARLPRPLPDGEKLATAPTSSRSSTGSTPCRPQPAPRSRTSGRFRSRRAAHRSCGSSSSPAGGSRRRATVTSRRSCVGWTSAGSAPRRPAARWWRRAATR
jgi:hypothetical protein